MNNATELSPQRFKVTLINPKGSVQSTFSTDVQAEAIKQFISLTNDDFGPVLGAGAYAALIDAKLLIDAAKVYEGYNCYRLQFYKNSGRLAFEDQLDSQ
jgi:hypothetical protein